MPVPFVLAQAAFSPPVIFGIAAVLFDEVHERSLDSDLALALVLEAREARSTIRLRVRYLAFQEEDGSFWEDWFDQQNVRPMPPDHDPSFILELKKGQPLEIDIEEGWWEVELSGRDGPNYLVTAKRYKVQHIVPLERLRPAWGWSQRERAWSELKTRPLQVVNEGSSKSSAKTSSSNKKRLGV